MNIPVTKTITGLLSHAVALTIGLDGVKAACLPETIHRFEATQ
jgi:hypothetical protein